MPSTRHAAILLCVVVLLAGCTGAPTDTTTTGTTTDTTATTGTAPTTSPTETTSQTTDTTHDRWVRGDVVEVDAARVARETSTPIGQLRSPAETLASRAVENGSASVTTVSEAPEMGTYPVVVDGAVWDIERSQVDSETVTVHSFEMDGPLREGTDSYQTAQAEAVAFENLSAADQRVVEAGIPDDENLSSISFGKRYPFHFEDGSPPDESVLVESGTHYVEYEGHYFVMAFDGASERERRTYRYSASKVAPSMSAYTDVALERYVTNVSNANLTPETREILVGAIENGSMNFHSEDPTIPDRYERFYQWTRDHRFVEYEGEYYWLQIMKVME